MKAERGRELNPSGTESRAAEGEGSLSISLKGSSPAEPRGKPAGLMTTVPAAAGRGWPCRAWPRCRWEN